MEIATLSARLFIGQRPRFNGAYNLQETSIHPGLGRRYCALAPRLFFSLFDLVQMFHDMCSGGQDRPM